MLRGALCLRRPEGFLAPRVVTPMELYGRNRGVPERWAGPTARLLAWTQLLLSEQAADRSLFPGGPAESNFAWALGISRSLCQAQDLLSEGGLTFSTAREAAGHFEPELWLRLAQWEERYRAILAGSGLRDPMEGRLEALKKGCWDFESDSVILVGCPDPHPLALRLLQAVLPERACSVLIHAPEAVACGFDAWGVPDPAFWQSRRLPFLPATRIYAEEGEIARRTADLVRAHRSREAVTIGVCDPRLLPDLRLSLEESGIPAFDPGGAPARGSAWPSLLADLRELLREKSIGAFRRLLCHPAAAAWMGLPENGAPRAFLLERLDRAASRTLARDFEGVARREPALAPFAEKVKRFLSEAREEPLATLRVLLEELLRQQGGGEGLRALSDELAAALEEMDALGGSALRPLDAAEALDLLTDRLARPSLPEERPQEAVELRGWLELLWDNAPHLILAGFHEGSVPESVTHDFLLPATLRERLGLRTNAQREARDAYLFEALVAQRRERGRVDLLACRFRREGEPLFPSRLLFRSSPEELPGRVRRVLEVRDSPPRAQPAASDSFRLQIGPLRWEGEKRLSITALRDYLACPFFFFLRRVRRWEAVEALREELDAREFGALLHDVLSDFGREEARKRCDRSEEIEECLRTLLSCRLRERFPEGFPSAVALQAKALEGRLAGFARAQAAEVRRGWTIVSVEEPISLAIEGWEIEGRIDRVDRDAEGRVRLLDFKSAERALSPRLAHLCAAAGSDGPAQALFDWRGKRLRWRDLQLPLYAAAWRRKNSGLSDLEVAYFVLPKDRAQAGVREWKEWSRELETEALLCAARILRAIEEGRFWPPADSLEWEREPWRSWFDGRPGELVSPLLASA
ncbi:PD-(D/E)XK nuclease family protein [Methylacidimicrobium sp. B4]|uniref:PD-(D/E)XK nuclease family protein n=1 Tax=Methylacidimicrobium sp. B4 TaxID=2796139 RepID=UPI001A8FA14A|nr:PD-(D/E)XK nuclease family protein [Methylacidimicrobium sp. B4]QSR84751.1 PD-(D/E)XK nuclease family protein [Methylacidimicrobium sp. B4]